MEVDTSRLEKAIDEYLTDTKKTAKDVVNTKAYFIVLNAMNETPAASKEQIKTDLMKGSNTQPNAPLAAILVNIQRKAKGLRGVNRNKMVQAVDKLIRIEQSHRNFLRMGWLPAKRILGMQIPSKRGAPKQVGNFKQRGSDKGYAIAAQDNSFEPVATVANTIQGAIGKESKVHALLITATQRGIDAEADNTEQHVLERRLKENADNFSRN